MRHKSAAMPARSVAVALYSLLASSLSFGEETWPIRQAEEKLLAGLNHQCSVLEQEIELGKELSLGFTTTEAQYAMQCQCLPPEFGKAVGAYPKDAVITQEAFNTLLGGLIKRCIGRTARARMLEVCDTADNKDVAAAERPRYCACMKRGLEALSDEQIHDFTQAALRNFEAKVKATREGTPSPAPESHPVDAITSSCKNP